MTSISLDGLNIALCQLELVFRGEMAERMEVHPFVSCRVTKGDQLILAPDPKDGQLGEVSEGSWIYYIEPEYLNGFEWSEKVRAELYRVQDAETNEGDRLVSDTKLISVPNPIPTIKLENSQTPNNGE